jgi:hypothetical protein
MSRFDKYFIIKMLRESGCIESPVLNSCFKSVWVGESIKKRIELSKRKIAK